MFTIDENPCYLQGIADFEPEVGNNVTLFRKTEKLPLSENHIRAIKAAWTPERRAAQSARCRASHKNHDPSVNAKKSKTLTGIAKTKAAVAASVANSAARRATPEHRKLLSDSTKARYAKLKNEK